MRPEFETTPKLGFGCMRLPLLDPADQQSIDLEQFKQMVDAFIEGGGTYFDTAFVYHEGASEKALKEALVKRYPRDAYTVATKCLAWAAPSAEEAKSNLATSLERMGLDYVDFYLLHNVGGERTAKFDAYGMWDFALDAKERGLIRNVGFSMHDGADALDALLTAHPQMDFVQLQVNYLDWDDPVVEARRCMEVAAKHGVPVVVMEPARGGRLVGLRLLRRAQALLDLRRALVHDPVDPGQGEPADEQQHDEEDDGGPEDLVGRRQDDGEAALLLRRCEDVEHGGQRTMRGRTKPMRPRASTMPAPIIMLVNRRPPTSG